MYIDSQTPAHEFGHMLGLGHNVSGLMYFDAGGDNRSWDVGSPEIKTMINNAITGRSDAKGVGRGKATNVPVIKRMKKTKEDEKNTYIPFIGSVSNYYC